MSELFVTGTDTGVGKTVVAAALLVEAVSRGRSARCFKPAESGCRRDATGALVPADAVLLHLAAGRAQPLDEVCPYRYEAAVAPGVAAVAEGPIFDPRHIAELVDRARTQKPDLLLVEGAGGLLVPFGEDLLAADLCRALVLPLLIVARPTLGTINHTLLTLEAARSRGIRVAGIVFSDADGRSDTALAASNAQEIERAGRVPILGTLPHLRTLEPTTLAAAARAHLRFPLLGRS